MICFEEVIVPSALALVLMGAGNNRRRTVQIYRSGYLIYDQLTAQDIMSFLVKYTFQHPSKKLDRGVFQ
jgi:hypothetical protein